jgi:hypothetical protein
VPKKAAVAWAQLAATLSQLESKPARGNAAKMIQIVIEAGAQTGLAGLLRGAPAAQASFDQAGGATAALKAAGFFPVRPLGDSEGLKFSEGLRPASAPAGDTAHS